MAKFIPTIQFRSLAICAALCAPSPLLAFPLAAQDDLGSPSQSTPDSQVFAASDSHLHKSSLRDSALTEKSYKKRKIKRSTSTDNPPLRSDVRLFYRENLALADLARIPHINRWFLKAAWNVVNKVKQRKQLLLSYTFLDVNGDGTSEAVVLAQTERRGSLRQSLAVYSFTDELVPILRFERHQNIASTVINYSRSVDKSNDDYGFSFCEDWRIASWQFRECHDIAFDAQWRAIVRAYEIKTREPQAYAAQYNRFDFKQMTATRTYSHLPDGSFLPAKSRSSDYEMIFAAYDDDKSKTPTLSRTAKFGSKTEPLAYAASWNDDELLLVIDLQDDDVFDQNLKLQNAIPQNNAITANSTVEALPPADKTTPTETACNETIALQTTDHVEIWIDLAPALQIDRNAPQTWQSEYENAYQQSPFRHEIDADIYAFAVTANGCVVPIHPMRDYWHGEPNAQIIHNPDGYTVNLKIPAPVFGTSSMRELAGPQGIGLSIIQHDIREDGDFETSKTSQWQWADPFSFGQLWLIRSNSNQTPTFPFEWNKFLNWQ